MSTRARVGMLNAPGGLGQVNQPPGSVVSVYVHFDGYPAGVGAILAEHYQDRAKIADLLLRGDVSQLGREIGERHSFDEHNSAGFAERGWCLFYHRDRGEENVNAKAHDVDPWPDSGQEWEYLHDPARGWLVREAWPQAGSWCVLADVLAEVRS